MQEKFSRPLTKNQQIQITNEGLVDYDNDQEADEENAFGDAYLNYREVGFDADLINSHLKDVLTKTRDFVERATKAYQTTMRGIMQEYREYKPELFTQQIMDKMIDRGYDLPEFTLFGGDEAVELLSRYYYLESDAIAEQGMVLVFQLPKPIARMWYRINSDYADDEGNIESTYAGVEWGRFYQCSIPTIWDLRDDEEYNGDLSLTRLNPNGVHDPNSYYYLWFVDTK
jgi:hypothetical protein